MQNQPGSDLVLADGVRFWPNGSGPEASQWAKNHPARFWPMLPSRSGPDTNRIRHVYWKTVLSVFLSLGLFPTYLSGNLFNGGLFCIDEGCSPLAGWEMYVWNGRGAVLGKLLLWALSGWEGGGGGMR